MARGWESKSIEDQIGAAEARKESRYRPALSADEIERRRKREGLMRERSRLIRELEHARNERYRALLTLTLQHVESELAAFERAATAS